MELKQPMTPRITISLAASCLYEVKGSPAGVGLVMSCGQLRREFSSSSPDGMRDPMLKALLEALRAIRRPSSVCIVLRDAQMLDTGKSGICGKRRLTLWGAVFSELSRHEVRWLLLGERDRDTDDFAAAKLLARKAAGDRLPDPELSFDWHA